jgi:hypothetical protein
MNRGGCVKRYDIKHERNEYGTFDSDIEEDPQGDYVKYTDIEKVVNTVKFYADKKNYKEGSGKSEFENAGGEIIEHETVAIWEDNGAEARQTLKELGIE